MADSINESDIVNSLHRVPVRRWKDVLLFLDSLQDDESPVTTGTDLADSELIGIWKERDDIENNREFARRLRTQAEQRGHLNAPGH